MNDDATLEGNLYAMGTDKVIMATNNQAALFSSLTLGGSVVLDGTLNAPRGTITSLKQATVGLSNVDSSTDASKPVSAATLTALREKGEYELRSAAFEKS